MEYFKNDWNEILSPIVKSEYFEKLMINLDEERKNHNVYPSKEDVFKAFNITAYNDVRVVIIGQDPYHTDGVADGLAFSTTPDAKIPPSLKNIFKELNDDLTILNDCPNLNAWAKQGVLLLNRSLSVREGAPLSHKYLKWEIFTNYVIKKLSERKEPIVFVLWGKEAQKLEIYIDEHHYIIKSAHPSPLSARHGFLGSKVFSNINRVLESFGYKKIDFKTR